MDGGKWRSRQRRAACNARETCPEVPHVVLFRIALKVFRLEPVAMLALLRKPLSRPTRSWTLSSSRRCLSTTLPRLNESDATKEPAEDVEPPDTKESDPNLKGAHDDGFKFGRRLHPRFVEWINDYGKQYMHAHKPKNWMGGEVVSSSSTLFVPTCTQYIVSHSHSL